MFKPNKIVKNTAFIFGVIALSLGLSYAVLAWTEPPLAPPGCVSGTPGCDAPLNVSSINQAKSGFLRLGGTTSPTETLMIGEAGAALGLLRTTGVAIINEGNGVGFSANGLLVLNGNVGIGTTTPGARLEVNGDVMATTFLYSSDERLKENIEKIKNPLEKIMKLDGVSFIWRENGEKSIGLIAQNVEEVFPELVKTNEESGMKSVEYGNLVAPLIEAIKEQRKMIENLQREIEALKVEINK